MRTMPASSHAHQRRWLTPRAIQKHPQTVNGFQDSAFEMLLASDLSDDLLMSLLGRLRRPDYSNLPPLIVRNLRHKQSRGFGSLSIHKNLLLEQLELCLVVQAPGTVASYPG